MSHDESCSRCQQFLRFLHQDLSKSSTSWADGIWTWRVLRQPEWSPYEKMSRSTHFLVPRSFSVLGLNSDTKQLTKCCFNRGASSRGITCLVMTLRQNRSFCGQFISLAKGYELPTGPLRFNGIFHVPALNARMVRKTSTNVCEAKHRFLGSPAEMIAQCKANEAEKTVKGLIDFAAYQSHTIPWDWYIHLHESLISYIIMGLFLI